MAQLLFYAACLRDESRSARPSESSVCNSPNLLIDIESKLPQARSPEFEHFARLYNLRRQRRLRGGTPRGGLRATPPTSKCRLCRKVYIGALLATMLYGEGCGSQPRLFPSLRLSYNERVIGMTAHCPRFAFDGKLSNKLLHKLYLQLLLDFTKHCYTEP